MGVPLRVLIVEDRPDDAELLVHELRRAGYEPDWRRVEQEEDYLLHLYPTPDLVLSDVALPQFDSMRALRLLKDRGLDVPFIVVTGAYEERGIECMKEGAADCLLKDRLARLGPAVENTLAQRNLRNAKQATSVALRNSEDRFALFMNASPVVAWMKDEDGRIVYLNRTFENVFQITLSASRGRRDSDLWPAPVAERLQQNDGYVLCAGVPLETTEILPTPEDPERVWLVTRFPVEDVAGHHFVGAIAVDVTERKRAEERFQRVVEASPSAMLMVNREGNIVLVNSQTEKYFGYTRDELLGQPVEILIPTRFRAKHAGYVGGFFAAPQARNLNAGRVLLGQRKDGSEFPIEIGLTPIKTHEGMMVLGAIVDNTERKRVETQLRETASALIVANAAHRTANEELRKKNIELDEFTFVASHDLQEPLRKIISFGELLPKDFGGTLPEAAEKDLNFIIDAARRMRVLVQDLLILSRAGRATMKRERVSLNECVELALRAVSDRIQETGARIQHEELPEVLGDPTLLTQLYQNLLSNALKFLDAGRVPDIRLSCEMRDDQWILGVCDNGIGIKSEYHEQIFAPFKRLHGHSEYEGSGIGLSICRKAVERHGGKMWVESEPGQGAHFKFTLHSRLENTKWLTEVEGRPSSSSPRMIPAIKS